MSRDTIGEEFVGSFLAHYASQYYDPQKAHEYYLQNRELKGKQSTSELTIKKNKARTEKRKEAWSYAKKQIGDAKKTDLKNLSAKRKAIADQARKTADARRQEISGKLDQLLKALTSQKSADSAKIDSDEKAALKKLDDERAAKARKIRDDANAKIDAIPPVPDAVRGPQRKRLVDARAKRVAKISGDTARDVDAVTKEYATKQSAVSADADSQRKALADKTTQERASGHESATASREQVSSQLKATVEKARADYEAGKERLIAEYEAKSQKEFDAIKANV